MTENLIAIGEVCGLRGARGEVKVQIYYPDPHRLDTVKEVFLLSPLGSDKHKTTISKLWYHRGTPIVHFEGITSIAAAEKIQGYVLMIPEQEVVQLQADEYFWHDLLGSRVYDTHDDLLGTIQEIMETGSNEVLIIRGSGREYLIPLLKGILKVVDLSRKIIIIDPLPGMLTTNED